MVYVIRFTPEAPVSPAAAMSTVTGDAEYQPAEHAAVLQVTEVVGAEPSACAVKLALDPTSPAPFVAVTAPLWSDVAALVKV